MTTKTSAPEREPALNRNVWAVSVTSFLTDISSDMVVNLVPLFLANVLGVSTSLIGLIEGAAEAIASVLKVFSGWLSDRLGKRKSVAVAGYAISAFSKPFYYFASTWGMVAAVRWADRVGKGVRTAPRDALIADSTHESRRGFAFGFQRAADTAGAVLGLAIALVVVWRTQADASLLTSDTFKTIVLVSLVPAFLAVAALAIGARDVPVEGQRGRPMLRLRGMGKPFLTFMIIVSIFELGNSSDAFLLLRAQERGLTVTGVLGLLIAFNVVYTLLSTPAGAFSDRIGRRKVIVAGWAFYALIYLGFARTDQLWQVWALYAFYGFYYALTYGTAKAMVADLVPATLRGSAFGTFNALTGVLDLPASLIAGILWQGIGRWAGFGPAAPFYFGALLAGIAAVLLWVLNPAAS